MHVQLEQFSKVGGLRRRENFDCTGRGSVVHVGGLYCLLFGVGTKRLDYYARVRGICGTTMDSVVLEADADGVFIVAGLLKVNCVLILYRCFFAQLERLAFACFFFKCIPLDICVYL